MISYYQWVPMILLVQVSHAMLWDGDIVETYRVLWTGVVVGRCDSEGDDGGVGEPGGDVSGGVVGGGGE